MSRLDELIAELCPDGVEFKSIGDFAIDIYRGTGITKDQITATGTPCVRYGQIYTTYNIWFDKCISYTDESIISNRKYFENGDILFAITGESVIDIAKSVAYVGHEKCLAGGDIVVLKHNQNPKYIAYALSTSDAISQKTKGKVKSKVVHSSVPAIKDLILPLPPLPVQEKIVRILDSFTELTAELTMELTAELTARKKQYEYYRHYLFSFEDVVPTAKLIDIAEISRGVRVVKKQLTTDGIFPVFQNSLAPMGYYNQSNCPGSTTYVISAGAAGEIGFCDKEFWAADDCLVFKNPNGVINRFIYHFLMTKQDFIRSNVRKASIPRLSRSVIENLCIPIIPINEQERIVRILDHFNVICNDLTSGLPAEIEARRKQYEYYRDKLLTFKEAK